MHGEVTFGPEVFDYDTANPDTPSSLDSAGHVPRSLVADSMFRWGADEPRRRSYSDTIIYEAHVKGLTMRRQGVPAPLRGTYAGLAHEAVIDHLTWLGVTAVELLEQQRVLPGQRDLLVRLGRRGGRPAVVHRRPGGLPAVAPGLPSAPVPDRRRGQRTRLVHPGRDGDDGRRLGRPSALALGIYLDGSDDPDRAEDGRLLLDDDFLVLVNAWWEPLDFTIPPIRPGQAWHPEIDSYDPDRAAGPQAQDRRQAGDRVTVGPRSVVVLSGPRPQAQA